MFRPLRFHDFYDFVHIDEKWFYVDTDRKTFYLTKNEKAPYRATQSKRFITKVMFMMAVARPRWDSRHNKWFDGRVGVWPYTETRPAQRNSPNRPKGTLITTTVPVNRERSRKMLVECVIPAIKSEWPGKENAALLPFSNISNH